MTHLSDFEILAESSHGGVQFYQVQEPGVSKQLYLVADPHGLLLQNLPGVLQLKPLTPMEGFRWLRGECPLGRSLAKLYLAGEVNEEDLADCLLRVVDTLHYLASTSPALLPDELHPNHVWRLDHGVWALDLAGVALTPGIRLGTGGNGVKAVGKLLRRLIGDQNRAGLQLPTHQRLLPALHVVMMRSLSGGFSSLGEVHLALQQLSSSKGDLTDELAVEATTTSNDSLITVDKPRGESPQVPYVYTTGLDSAKRNKCRIVFIGLVVIGFTAAISGLALRYPWSSSESQVHKSPLPDVPPVEGEVVVATDIKPTVASNEISSDSSDVFTADRTYLRRRIEGPNTTLNPLPTSTGVPGAKPGPPKPVSDDPELADPASIRDRQIAGNNRITVRLLGKPLGKAYMFTNPGAPVMSLETLSRLLNRHIESEFVSPQQLRLKSNQIDFLTTNFILADDRVWLVLKPQLAAEFGLQVVSYGSGFLDLEPRI